MPPSRFAGDRKVGRSLLARPEQALVAWGTPRVPRWLQTYHLTLLTLLWSAGNVGCGWLARHDLRWLWGVSAMIVLQYVSDLFDGAVGRRRDTGLVKWGFYMDHFLDYVFLGTLLLAGYLIAPPGLGFAYLLLLLLTGGFMVNSFLNFAATNAFEITCYGIGPTEARIGFIILNTVIIYTGTDYFPIAVPWLCAGCGIALAATVVRSSVRLWRLDLATRDGRR